MAKNKKGTNVKQSSEEMYIQAMSYFQESNFQNSELLKLGALSCWRSFCTGHKDAAFALFEFFYECNTKNISQDLPLAYTFYRICQLIEHPRCKEYKDQIGIERLVSYLDCAKAAYRNFTMAHDRIGNKSITFTQNFDLSLFYYNGIVLPDGVTLAHSVLSKVDTEWDDGLTQMEGWLAECDFYECSVDMLFSNCIYFAGKNKQHDNSDENATLMGGQDDSNSGCCCTVM